MALRPFFACCAGLLTWGTAGSAPPDPLDAKAAVPTVVYPSAFKAYRRLDDARPVPWKQANDTVERIGGWRAYAREASQPDAPASAPAATTPAPARASEPAAPASGRSGHKH
jgi:hypothetical protein